MTRTNLFRRQLELKIVLGELRRVFLECPEAHAQLICVELAAVLQDYAVVPAACQVQMKSRVGV